MNVEKYAESQVDRDGHHQPQTDLGVSLVCVQN